MNYIFDEAVFDFNMFDTGGGSESTNLPFITGRPLFAPNLNRDLFGR